MKMDKNTGTNLTKGQIALGLLVLLVGVIMFSSCANYAASNAVPASEPRAIITSEPLSPTAPREPAPVIVAVPGPAVPLTTFGDGTWEIGVDIEPGKYKSTGPKTDGYASGLCLSQGLKKNNGEIGDIVDQKVNQGPTTVIIPAKGYLYFNSSGCENWVKVG